MADEEFDIMKPISPHLDIGKTMFDEPALGSTSATLDIGKTMFDEPAPVSVTKQAAAPINPPVAPAPKIKAEPVTVMERPAPKPVQNMTPPPAMPRQSVAAVHNPAESKTSSAVVHKGRGRQDLDFGYLTPEEAALLDSDNTPEPAPVELNTGPVQRVEMDSPLEKALDQLDDLVDQGELDKKQTERLMSFRNAAANSAVPPVSIAEARGAGVYEGRDSLERESDTTQQSEIVKKTKSNTAVKVVVIVFIVFAAMNLLSFIFPLIIFFLSLIFS